MIDKDLVKNRLELLMKLIEETQPDILDDNYLFQPHHWKVQNWIELLEKDELESSISSVMKDANAMWSFRNRFKNGDLDKNNWNGVQLEEEIKEFLIKGNKINAIKHYRKHKIEDLGEPCSLRKAKDYIDSLQEQYQRQGIM